MAGAPRSRGWGGGPPGGPRVGHVRPRPYMAGRERGLSVFPVRVVLGRLPPSSHMFRAISVEEKADRSVLVLQRIGMFFVFYRRCLVCFARFVFLAARLSRKTASSYLFV